MEERSCRGQTLEGYVEPATHKRGTMARPQSLIRPLHFQFLPPEPHLTFDPKPRPYAQD